MTKQKVLINFFRYLLTINIKIFIALWIKLSFELKGTTIFQRECCCYRANFFLFAHVLVRLRFLSIDVLPNVKEIMFEILSTKTKYESIKDIRFTGSVWAYDTGKCKKRSGKCFLLLVNNRKILKDLKFLMRRC